MLYFVDLMTFWFKWELQSRLRKSVRKRKSLLCSWIDVVFIVYLLITYNFLHVHHYFIYVLLIIIIDSPSNYKFNNIFLTGKHTRIIIVHTPSAYINKEQKTFTKQRVIIVHYCVKETTKIGIFSIKVFFPCFDQVLPIFKWISSKSTKES